jgi:hypothetical protein
MKKIILKKINYQTKAIHPCDQKGTLSRTKHRSFPKVTKKKKKNAASHKHNPLPVPALPL